MGRKLADRDLEKIRARLSEQEPYSEIARDFGLSISWISKIAGRYGLRPQHSRSRRKGTMPADERLRVKQRLRGDSVLLEKWHQKAGDPYHINAKEWVITSPGGRRFAVRNLKGWCHFNAKLFEPHPWEAAYFGFKRILCWLSGSRRKSYTHWQGWTVERVSRSCERLEDDPSLL
jgi:hypothetical protein